MLHAIESSKNNNQPRTPQNSGWTLYALILSVLLLSACSLVPKVFDSSTRVIQLREAPLTVPCERGVTMASCIQLLQEDWEDLVIDYKAKCLLLGGKPAQCWTGELP